MDERLVGLDVVVDVEFVGNVTLDVVEFGYSFELEEVVE